MKRIILCLILGLMGAVGVIQVNGQNTFTPSFTVLQNPCNQDGIIQVTIDTAFHPPFVIWITPASGEWYSSYPYPDTTINANVFELIGLKPGNFLASINFHPAMVCENNCGYFEYSLPFPFTFGFSQSPITCPTGNNGSLTINNIIGGTPPFNFDLLWKGSTSINNEGYDSLMASNNTGSFTNIDIPGIFNIAVEDDLGCTVSLTELIDTNYNYVSFSPVDTLMNFVSSFVADNCSTGTATFTVSGSHPPFTLYCPELNASGLSISGIPFNQTFMVLITDNQGCSFLKSFNTAFQTSILLNSTESFETCNDGDGAISLFVSGGQAPYTFAWSNGETVQNISNLHGGGYEVEVTDINGCSTRGGYYVQSISPLILIDNSTTSQCTTATGVASVFVTDGTPPYTYQWEGNASTTNQITNAAVGSYQVRVTDATGCSKSAVVIVRDSSNLAYGYMNYSPTCLAADGSISLNIAGNFPPFNVVWANGSTGDSVSNLVAGTYNFTITDQAQCIMNGLIYLYANNNNLQGDATSVASSCKYIADGMVYFNTITGGTPPYTVTWPDGTIGDTLANQYTNAIDGSFSYVTITDVNGCLTRDYYYISFLNSTTCTCNLVGNLYDDQNQNCQWDTLEPPIRNACIQVSGAGFSQSIYTDYNGQYFIPVPQGNYTLTEQLPLYHSLSPCQPASIAVDVSSVGINCQQQHDFANVVTPALDLATFITSNVPCAWINFGYSQTMVVSNHGTLPVSTGNAVLYHQPILQYDGLSPNLSYDNVNHILRTPTLSLQPSQTANFPINYNVPGNLGLNQDVYFRDTAFVAPYDFLSDNTPWNNIATAQTFTCSSYDPNIIEAIPRGTGDEGIITTQDSVMRYVIHFQNTGNFFAKDVMLTQAVDEHYDLSTLRPDAGSFPFSTSIANDVLKVKFNNIMLPDSASNPEGSKGWMSYYIRQKPNLAQGTQFRHTAKIYFDQNPAIITNTALNTIDDSGIKSYADGKLPITSFPNPSAGDVVISFNFNKRETVTFLLVDMLGNRILPPKEYNLYPGNFNIKFDTSELPQGIYFIQTNSNAFAERAVKVVKM